jgi:hypothetical protein
MNAVVFAINMWPAGMAQGRAELCLEHVSEFLRMGFPDLIQSWFAAKSSGDDQRRHSISLSEECQCL